MWRSMNAVAALSALVSAAVLLAVTSIPVEAKIYQWRDRNGQLHFTDSEANIPAEYREGVLERQATPEVEQKVPAPAATPAPKSPSPKSGGNQRNGGFTIPYVAREGTANRVIINMTFNGRVTVPILVDTGSPGLVLSASLANRLGLFDEEGSQLLVGISGIGGSEIAVRTIIDKLQIGSATEEFVPAHIVRQMANAYQGLVGMDILSRYTLTIDSARRQLIASENPEAAQLPGGRSREWWQTTFQEFQSHHLFWENQMKLVDDSGGPYRRLSSSRRDELREFIGHQHQESRVLLEKLDRYASWKSVPRHWRR